MNNPYTYNLHTDNCLPQGLSTAHIGPLRTERQSEYAINDTDQGIAHLSYAVGGSVSSISIEDHRNRNRDNSCMGNSRGIRRKVHGFSSRSRRNLLRHLASINRTTFRAFKGRLISVTLTYPREYPENPEVCKNHLKALRKRLEREYGGFAAFWRMGIQKRGAFHFHLLLFVPRAFGSVRELRSFISSS